MAEQQEGKFLRIASHFAELGYPVFPLEDNGKKPVIQHGLTDATTDEMQIQLWSDAFANANVGLRTDEIIVVDHDPLDNGDENPWLKDQPQRYEELRKHGPHIRTPRGGTHIPFKMPAYKAYKNSVGTATRGLALHVDIRAGTGGYVVAPGSTIGGKTYASPPGFEWDCPRDQLPELPQFVQDILDERKPATVASADSAPEVVHEGGRNAYLTRTAGALRRSGCDEAEILALLQTRNATKCRPPLDDAEVRTIAKSVAGYEPDQIAELIVNGTEPAPAIVDPGHLPRHLLKPPGLMSDFIDYAISGATRIQLEATLAAAITLVAVITGQKVRGATGLRTNVMTLALCGTGGGKERPRQALKESIYAADMGHLIPFEEIASSAALLNAVTAQPVCLFPIDEMGKFLRTTKDAASNPHVADIIGLLLKFFSQAGSTYAGRGHADLSKRKAIVNPHVCVFGTSVRESVLSSITEENLTDGFISRLSIFESSNDNPEAVRRPYVGPPSAKLIEQLQWWNRYMPPVPAGAGNLSHTNTPYPRLIDDGPGVEDLFYEADERFRSYQNADQIGSAVWKRAHEKARTLALIWQCSADCQSEFVTMEAARWALELVEHLTRRIILLANEWVADNRQGRLVNKIVRKMREKGGELPLWGISRLLQKDATTREVRELLETMTASGTVVLDERKTTVRPSIIYRLSA